MSERTARRALSLATDLGVLFSAGQGRDASDRTILYARLREMVAVSASLVSAERAAPTCHSTRQTELSEAADWQVDDTDLAGRTTENGRSTLYSDLSPNQPTTTDGGSSDGGSTGDVWVEVEREVLKRGVERADLAVPAARSEGATPADVRALLAHFDQHRSGWSHPAVALYRRLRHFELCQAASDGWPEFMEEYQRRLAREKYERESAAQERLQIERRSRVSAGQQRSLALWREGFSMAQIASEIAPELAEAIETGCRRRHAREEPTPSEGERATNVLRVLQIHAEREAAAKESLPRPP
jgi:hypothetical protein